MSELSEYENLTDEEIIRRYSVLIEGHRYTKREALDYIGTRQAKKANRQPGDPGTPENPIFIGCFAYVYNQKNNLVLWEDYNGTIPSGTGVRFFINSATTEAFKLTYNEKLSPEQEKMIEAVKNNEIVYDDDCPDSTDEQLERFRRFGMERNRRRALQMNISE